MLTVEIRINGSIITAATVHNTGEVVAGKSHYEYQCVRFPADCRGPAETTHGFFNHKRSEGAEALVSTLMKLAAVAEKT